MGFISTYVAYRYGKKGYEAYKVAKKHLIYEYEKREALMDLGCHRGEECILWYAQRAIRSYTLPDGQLAQAVKDDVDWHKEHNVDMCPPYKNWRVSGTIIAAILFRKGDKQVKRIASPALKTVWESIDLESYSGYDGCSLLADQIFEEGSYNKCINRGKDGFRAAFLRAAEAEEGESLELEMRDYEVNVPGLGR